MQTFKKVVLITGGNGGLGLATVRSLIGSQQPYHVILSSRSLGKAEAAVSALQAELERSEASVEAVEMDIERDDSIRNAFEKVRQQHDRIDVLLNNAGVQFELELVRGKISMREAWARTYNVNVVGTQVVTDTFMPLLLHSADPRILFISSSLSSLGETSKAYFPVRSPMPAGWPKPRLDVETNAPYRSSKAALNMMMLDWYWRLKPDEVKVWAVCPGFLATGIVDVEILRKMGAEDPSVGAKFVLEVIEGGRDDDVGKVVDAAGIRSW